MNKNTAVPAVKEHKEHSASSVGSLHGEVWLTVQSYQAQSLLRGRRASEAKSAIVGLVGFADRLKTLWQAVRQDDPYADWWLIKVEEGIALCRAQLGQLSEQVNALLTSYDCFDITVAQSRQPQRISLQFANPYAFRAAQLLAEYDRIICTFMTLRHLGVEIPQTLEEQFKGSGRWLRRVFALPQDYCFCDVDRCAILQSTQRAQKARERMGDVPRDILRGDTLPSLRPIDFRMPALNDLSDSPNTAADEVVL